jgi:hypothetical protein
MDESTSGGAASPNPVANPAAPAPAAESNRGKLIPIIIVGGLIALLGIILFAVRNNTAADDLKVGECFNIPNGTTVRTVEKQACSESHNAEVIFVGDYDGDSFPISLSLDRFIESACVPAFETYIGRDVDSEPELSIGYFHPTRDGWDGGDRTVTCYVAQPDESPMTQSLKG